MLKIAMTNTALIGSPFELVLANHLGKLPSRAIEYMALAAAEYPI
jgi:hypothetical protein